MLHWGIIGTGLIAKRFALGVQASTTGRLWAVASRTESHAAGFAATYVVPHAYTGYQRLLDDPQVQAVYISTPHPLHAEWAIKAAEAGKHVLVEKPCGMNWPEAMAMVDAARVHDVFFMEAFMYRCHPQTRKLLQLIREGAIGEVRVIQGTFSYHTGAPLASRFFAQELGGGGILDVGCYPVSMARLIAGVATGQHFAEPIEVKGCGHLGGTGTDDWASCVMKFSSGIVATAHTGLRVHQPSEVRIFGSSGYLVVPQPWQPTFYETPARLWLYRGGQATPEDIVIDCPHDIYTYEADTVAHHLGDRQAPAMSWDDSLGNMRVLDQWREQIGLVYDLERPAAMTHTLTRRPLARHADAPMTYGTVPGVTKPVARLVFGCDSNNTMPWTAAMIDHYFERGGNAFDTSYAYGHPNGACERMLGQWVRNRGVRDQVVILEKGANPPYCTPAGLTAQLLGGLERLQLDQVDIYLMHRDNPEVPVGEFIDVLNEHQRAGRMRVFGVSNWTLERIQAAQAYAAAKGLQGFTAISNQFSLAHMLVPVWDQCVSANTPAFRAWLTQTQTTLMPWSSQGRGFFTERAHPDKRDEPELLRCWYGADNFARKARAEALARKYQVAPINIALAWVLCQPFPTLPLIGPKQHCETRSCLEALKLQLTPHELAWLDLAAEHMDG